MDREQLEFQISQYADGTLPATEAAALEATLASDAAARELLEEYRQLDVMLKRELPLPQMNWERLADHLSDSVAKEDAATRTIAWPLRQWGRVAVAAMVLIAVGLGVWRGRSGTTQLVSTQPAVMEITGPAPERAAGPAVAIITIDASPLAKQNNYRAAETIVYRPSRVLIASGPSDRQDTRPLPY
jgi:anti-sigma factor RsiW